MQSARRENGESKNLSSFLKTMRTKLLSSEIRGLKCALTNSDMYCKDLQGMIDLNGNYHHIDIDTQFRPDEEFLIPQTIFKKKIHAINRYNDMVDILTQAPRKNGTGLKTAVRLSSV